jgi:ABC-type sugar transport system ATPase subunit
MTIDNRGTSMSENAIRVENLSKSFGSVQALEDVSFNVRENEVLALMGDNGAGKSTLIKILSGVLAPTSGTVYVDNESVSFDDYTDARAHGIETIYQDLAVAEGQSVMNNVFMGKELIVDNRLGRLLRITDDEQMMKETQEILERLDMNINPQIEAGSLSGGQQQAVAIGRALQSSPSILIMDEPTSALSVDASQRVLDLIQELRNQGLTIILVNHNIDEVFEVADRAAVLATGNFVGTEAIENLTEHEMIQMMMGAGSTSDASEMSA